MKDCQTGFKKGAKTLYVIYWSKGGLALYNEKAASNVSFWDATGSVFRRSDDSKQMLYYELAIRHLVKVNWQFLSLQWSVQIKVSQLFLTQ